MSGKTASGAVTAAGKEKNPHTPPGKAQTVYKSFLFKKTGVCGFCDYYHYDHPWGSVTADRSI